MDELKYEDIIVIDNENKIEVYWRKSYDLKKEKKTRYEIWEGWVGIYSKLGRQNPESVSAKSRVGFFLTRFCRWFWLK